MKRSQVAALVAGAALGLTGVAVAVALSRKEGRDAAKKLLDRAAPVAEQAMQLGQTVSKTAAEQYQVFAPKAAEALKMLREQAPQTAETLVAALPKLNGRHETVEA